MKEYVFREPLLEGVILSRQGSVALTANLQGSSVYCHFPARGRLSGIRLSGRPCLLSQSNSPERRTPYTVEAFSLNRPEDEKKRWIGLNRYAVKEYVTHYLPRREFMNMLQDAKQVSPCGSIAGMKTDFRIGDTYLLLQTPMQELNILPPAEIQANPNQSAPFGIRMVKQLRRIAENIGKKQRLIILLCYLYDSPPTVLCRKNESAYGDVRSALEFMHLRGVEIWQANFRVEPERVWLIRNFAICPDNIDGTGIKKTVR